MVRVLLQLVEFFCMICPAFLLCLGTAFEFGLAQVIGSLEGSQDIRFGVRFPGRVVGAHV